MGQAWVLGRGTSIARKILWTGQIVSANAAGIAGTSAYSQSAGLTPVHSNKKRGLYPSGIGPEPRNKLRG